MASKDSCRNIVFFDADVPAHALLAQGLPSGTDWALLDARSDPLAQITTHLQGRTPPAALHLVSHGQPGALLLGGVALDVAALQRQRAAWQALGDALAPGGALLLYGCEVARGDSGRHFVHELARLTGAHVAASARPTGATARGGDATLEVHTGGAASAAPAALLSQATFDRAGVLLATLPASIAPLTGSWFHTAPAGLTSFNAAIGSTSEVDYFFFAVETTGSHTFTLTPAAGLDVQFCLYDQTGAALIASRDLFGSGNPETVSFALTAGQYVYVGVAGFGTTTGDYGFSLTPPAPTTTALETVGPTYTAESLGQINHAGDIDFFSVTAPADTTLLSLSLVPSGFNAVLRLYSASGTVLQTINSAGTGGTETLNSFAVTAGTTYLIGISTDNVATSSGSYTLSADFNPDDPGLPPASVTPGSGTRLRLNPLGDLSAVGSIDSRPEVDLYAFYANTAGSHVISVADSGVDILFRVYGADGQPLGGTVDVWGTPGVPATETTTVDIASAGWVYVAVSGWESETGNYTLSVNGPSATTATLATPGTAYTGSASASISPAGQQDFFQLTAPAGTTSLALDLAPTGFDGRLEIYDSNGTRLQIIDSDGSGVADAGTVNVSGGSSYFVGVSGAASSGSGTYTLNADFDPDDPGDPPASVVPGSQAIPLRPKPNGDDGFGSVIGSRSETQLAVVRVDNPGSFTFTMQSSEANSQFRVYGGDGQPLTSIIDANGTGVDETVTVSLPAGYAYVVTALAGSDTGAYDLLMNGPSYAATPVTLALPAYTATVQTDIAPLQAKVWAVTVPAGVTSLNWSYSASVTGFSGEIGLYRGESLSSTLQYGQESQTGHTIVAGEQYYIRVLSFSDADDALVTFNLDFNPDANSTPTASSTTANATEDTPLNGTLPAATDINSDPITYALASAAANGTAVVNADGSYSYTPIANFNGSDSFGYTVSDNRGGSNSYTVSVTVAAVNDAPVAANAITPPNATESTAYSYTVPANAFSDVDSATLTYTASLAGGGPLPAWLSFNAATRNFSGTPTVGSAGNLNLRVTASDGLLSASPEFVLVVVENSPPLSSFGNYNLVEDTVLNGVLPTATDVDGDAVTYSLATPANIGTAIVNADGSFSYTPAADVTGNAQFSFFASDGKSTPSAWTVFIAVTPVNDAPVVANALGSRSATANTAFSFTVPATTFNDVDGDTLTYSATLAGGGDLPGWLSFNPGTRAFSGTPLSGNVGTVNVRVVASDGALSASSDFALVVNAAPNSAPTASSTTANATEDTVLNGTLPAATDADGDTVSYALAAAASNGTAQVNANGSYSYTPSADFNGSDSFGYTVSDTNGGSNSYTVSITVAAVNDAPAVANALTAQSATANSAFAFTVPLNTFTDVDSPTLAYSATLAGGGTLPAWLSFNPDTRAFSGTPLSGNVGTVNVRVVASDGALSASSDFALVVNAAPNVAPIAENVSANATEDTMLTGNLPAASDDDGDLIFYARGTAATNGTAVVNANGFYTYTPNANFNGSDSFGYTVSDTNGGSNSYTVSITVAAVNDAPAVANALTTQGATANSAFAFTVPLNTFSDVDSPTLTYSATLAGGGTLPAWLSFNPGTRAFSGTPLSGNVGTLNVRVTTSDGALSASSDFALVVNAAPNVAPIAENVSANATEDTMLTGNLPAASDDDGDLIFYARGTAATNGTAVVNANGFYTYTPNANFNGSDSFGYTVSDTNGGSNSYTVSITVAAVNDAPAVANALTTQGATANSAFAFTVPLNTFSDVDSPTLTYSATLAGGGTLPAWLSFNPGTRAFSGTPLSGNVGTLNVRVTTSDGALSASSDFALVVNAAPNVAPIAENVSANATEDTMLTGNLPAANDDDGDLIFYARGTAATNGTAVVNANGFYTYTPNANFNGSDSFGYTVSDTNGGSNSYTVSITVAAVNDAPVVANALTAQSATANSAFAFTVPVNTFSDVDSPTLAYSATLAGGGDLPAWLSFNPTTRAFGGTPAAGNVGTLNVRVVASDGALSASSDFALVVNAAPNVAPIAENVSANATEDTMLTGNLPAASDDDGDLIFYARGTAATNGTAVVNANGFYTYTPNANFNGSDSFGYTVSDTNGGSNSYTVSITVAAVNDAPTGAVVLGGTAQVGQVLSANTGGVADADGLGPLSYQWLRGAGVIAGATGSAYTLTEADVNSRISVRVSWVDGNGSAESLVSPASAAVVQPNSRPTGSVNVAGTTRIFETLSASHTLADNDGLGTITYQWLRDGVPIPGATGPQYLLLLADVNTSITVRASYTDGAGQAESVSSSPSAAIAGFEVLVGTAGRDSLVGSARPDEITGLAGNDGLSGGDGRDLLRGGEGNDVLVGGSGNDTLDGGPGLDLVDYRLDTQAVAVNLLQQRATRSGEEDTLIDIEAFFGSQAGDTFVGAEAAEHLRSDTVRGGRGNDTLDGGGGVDTAEYVGNYAAFSVQRTGSRLVVTDLFNPQGGEGVDQLNNFERVIFADKMLAFGSRAEEVARVAFALWTPEIVGSSTLFSRGLSFYDVGYDFNFLCFTALQFWPQQGQEFAQMLVNNTRGTSRTVADVLAIMNAAGPGDTGRAAAVAAMALDPAMTQLITLSGVLSTGVVADLVVPDFGTLFELLPG